MPSESDDALAAHHGANVWVRPWVPRGFSPLGGKSAGRATRLEAAAAHQLVRKR